MKTREQKSNEAYRSMVQTQLLINKKPGYDPNYGNANIGVQQLNANQSSSQYQHQVGQVLRNNKLR